MNSGKSVRVLTLFCRFSLLALTAIDAADDQRRATCQNRALSSGEAELLGTVLDAIPVILEEQPNHDFRESSLSGAILLQNVFRWLFNTPEALPQFFESILDRSDTLATSTGALPLLDLLRYRVGERGCAYHPARHRRSRTRWQEGLP